MSIPDFQTLMLPVLKIAAEGEVRISDVVEKLADKFTLSTEFPPRVDGVEYALTHQAVGDNGAAIRDAVRCGINVLQNQPAQFRRIILLLSQEEDSGSESRFADVLRDVARSGTTIYSFTFSSHRTTRKSHKIKPQHRNVGDSGLPSSPDAAELAVQSGGENVQFSGEESSSLGSVEPMS